MVDKSRDYELKAVVGKGAFAKVYHAVSEGKTDVAVKVMDLEDIQSDLQEITSEVRTMKMMKNASILPIYCSFIVNEKLWLVMPLLEKGSCLRIMRCLKRRAKATVQRRLDRYDSQVCPRGPRVRPRPKADS